MSKMYKAKDGFTVLKGVIKDVAENNMSMNLSVMLYNTETKKEEEKIFNVRSLNNPITQKAGYTVTVVGAAYGKDGILADFIGGRYSMFENAEYSVITSVIKKAARVASRTYETQKKDEDGNLVKDEKGNPVMETRTSKEKFEITLPVRTVDENGETIWVQQKVATYNGNQQYNQNAIKDMENKFKKFVGVSDKGYPIMTANLETVIVTSPGNGNRPDMKHPWTDKDGVKHVNIYNNHVGIRNAKGLEFEIIKDNPKAKEDVKSNDAPAQEAPVNEGSGFNEVPQGNEPDIEDIAEQEMFS